MSPGRTLVKLARLEGLEPPTLCFEGRCSIQLSYRRAVCFCNRITELAAWESDSPNPRRCAQFCAHLAETSPRPSLLRMGERIGRKLQSDCVQRSEPTSTRRSRIRVS